MNVVWPLVGRRAELDRVGSLLRSRSPAVVLAGKAGVGKTRLATECLNLAASSGYATLRVAATHAAAELPFGAYAPVVPELEGGIPRANVLRQITRSIVESGQGKPVAIMVDDAHLLDDASAALTHMLAMSDRTCLLATLRSGERAADPIVALWKDGLAERLEVLPLSASEVADLLGAALQGPVDGATVHELWARTEGNALFLRELVLGAIEAKTLRNDNGIWRLSGTLPTSARLIEIIESRLGQLDPPLRRGLEILAVGEPLELELLRMADPGLDLEELERRGILHLHREGRRLSARLHHPLYREALREKVSELRARSVAGTLAARLESLGARRREDLLRLATWQLDGGVAFRPETMLAAAIEARNRHDFALAERLARAAVHAGAGFPAELLLGQLFWHQGRGEEANRQLESLVPRAATDAERAMLGAARVTVLDLGLKRPEDALRVAEETASTIADPYFLDEINVERARVLGRTGHHEEAVTLVKPVLTRASDRTLISAAFAAATSMPLTGRIAETLDATQRGLEAHLALQGPPWTFGPQIHLAFQVYALWNAGRLTEAWDLGIREYETAVLSKALDAQGFLSVFLACVALLQGRVQTSERLARQAASLFRQIGIPMMLRSTLSILAHSLALRGEVGQAREALGELDALRMPPTTIIGPEVLRARAWTSVAAEDIPAALQYLEQAVEMARAGGARVLESAALHDFVRLGYPKAAATRLQQLANDVEGPLAPVRAAHAASAVTGDPAGLEEVSGKFEMAGAILLAAESAADAAVAWRRAGNGRKAVAAERRLAALAQDCEGARTPALETPAPTRATLTPRELEIARLAAGGLSNRAIAERLYLSNRTVENKLHAAYEKLGVQGRGELARALDRAS